MWITIAPFVTRRTKKGIIRKLKSRICGFFCMLSKHDGIRFY
ncbi:hypothetical protein ECDEC2E_5428 [Escherichia coli DEC2E]|nr:hypothetical protein ECDEC2E_5428 [Escherichia coli DEC2E]